MLALCFWSLNSNRGCCGNLNPADTDNLTGRIDVVLLDPLPRVIDAACHFAFRRAPAVTTTIPTTANASAGNFPPANVPFPNSRPLGNPNLETRVPGTHSVARPSRRSNGAEGRGWQTELSANDSSDSARRMVSETAHDMRAPLSTIREAVQLVRNESLGQLTSAQRECLSAAINQCDYAGKLVDEMVQPREFESGFPGVRRQWISIDDLRQSVEATLQPWMMPREIHLLWDGPFGQDIRVYADATLLHRLMVNLASNAIRVTRPGRPVLIRTKSSVNHGVMVWSVVDQGDGISSSDMDLIAMSKAPARSVGGLGLMISRQLAAAHFGTLRMESRVGTGTAVSFQTAFGGPAAVAARWIKWRSELTKTADPKSIGRGQLGNSKQPRRQPRRAGSIISPRRVRIDIPSQTIDLGIADLQPAHRDHVYLTTLSVGAATPASGTDAFDGLLQRTMRMTELAYRTGRRSWVIAWDADDETGARKRIELERLVQNELGPMRITWGDHSVVSETGNAASRGSLSTRLPDLIVRETLSASQHSFCDTDQVRQGTEPIQPSSTAANRLERHIRRLLQQRRKQQTQIGSSMRSR